MWQGTEGPDRFQTPDSRVTTSSHVSVMRRYHLTTGCMINWPSTATHTFIVLLHYLVLIWPLQMYLFHTLNIHMFYVQII